MSEHVIGQRTEAQDDDGGFLPDFCSVRIVFIMIVIAELLAFILALGTEAPAERWRRLSLLSLFIQWVTLSCTAALCLSRRRLHDFGHAAGGAAAYALILTVAALMSEAAYRIGRGTGLEQVLPAARHAEFVLRSLVIAAILGAVVLRYFYAQDRMRRTYEAQSQARCQALQARIRPHFMFNSMNTIASLTRTDPVLAEQVVEDLADLFRVSLAGGDGLSTLAAEIEIARRYLRIEQLRLGERLRVDWALDALPGDARVPVLMLQPLLENAIYHGIEPLTEGGTVSVSGQRSGGNLALIVRNPKPVDGPRARRAGHQMALADIGERLRLHYGRRGRLIVIPGDDSFEARAEFPYETAP